MPCLRLSGGAARQRAAPTGARPARPAGNDPARPHPPLPLFGLRAGLAQLIADPTRFDGVQVLGVDEFAWRHTRRGDKFVSVIIDLTPVRDGTGPSRLLDMVEGRSKQVFKTWLEAQTPAFRNGIEIEAMDGFTGFKTAAAEEIPDAVAVQPRSGSVLVDKANSSVARNLTPV